MSRTQATHRKHRWIIQVVIAAVVLVVGFWGLKCGIRAYQEWLYPYGWSHSCDKALLLDLLFYAEGNDGNFPAGESSPEASLSLLARPPHHTNAEILRGKTIPKDVVEATLARGELLGPETCGWHYVEGLRKDDDLRIVIFWDKAGLGHNGERMSNGNRNVARISGINETIPRNNWDAFLNEQMELLEKLPEDRRKLAMRNFPKAR